ncbi:MAG TPA: hypothetical protein DF294_02790 [Psychrobacter sp.]|nr:hypothetical protein [Psychrobacter sp.]
MIKLSVRSIDLIICLIIVKSFWTMAKKPSSQSIDKDIITLSGKRFTSALMCFIDTDMTALLQNLPYFKLQGR